MKFIDELRQRPEEERLAFAAFTAGAVGLVLFLAWGIVFFRSDTNVARVEVEGQQASAAETLQRAQEDFDDMMGEFSVQYAQFQNALDETRAAEEEGVNTVQLSVDKNGDVSVDTIVVPKEELEASQTQ